MAAAVSRRPTGPARCQPVHRAALEGAPLGSPLNDSLDLEIRLLLGIVLGVQLTRLAAVLTGSQLTHRDKGRSSFVGVPGHALLGKGLQRH